MHEGYSFASRDGHALRLLAGSIHVRWILLSVMTLTAGCTGNLGVNGAGGGGGSSSTLPADAGLPCAAAELISACVSCHGSPLAGGAPMPLLTRADLLAASPLDSGLTQADRSVLRLRDSTSPMPPSGTPSAAAVDAFAAWVAAGLPEGSCAATNPDPPVLTCASSSFLPRPVDGDAHGGDSMAPGLACIACHSGVDFLGQNPGGRMQRADEVKQYMGTVFTAPHEKELCAPGLGVAARVEILDLAGAVVATLQVNAGGNFSGNASPPPSSYRARVVTAQGIRQMSTAQTNGDCNTCHTAEGREGAPGRIFLP